MINKISCLPICNRSDLMTGKRRAGLGCLTLEMTLSAKDSSRTVMKQVNGGIIRERGCHNLGRGGREGKLSMEYGDRRVERGSLISL